MGIHGNVNYDAKLIGIGMEIVNGNERK